LGEYSKDNRVLMYVYIRSHNRIGKVCALVAATLVLPFMAYAGTDNGKGNGGQNNGNQYGHDKGDRSVPVVPEANAGWVLIPFVGAVLLFSARRLFHAKESR
jgi:hypothetical protein